ncbi:hypothetical protein ACLOJK_002233 [Asimina triloba]
MTNRSCSFSQINLGIYMEDNKTEFSLLVDRSVGGSSLVDVCCHSLDIGATWVFLAGVCNLRDPLEVILPCRRLLHDDSKGVGEALNETVCVLDKCEGLTIQGKFYLRIDPVGDGAKWRRTTGQEIYSPLLLAFTQQDEQNWTSSHLTAFTAMDPSYSLPDNVAMISLQGGFQFKDFGCMGDAKWGCDVHILIELKEFGTKKHLYWFLKCEKLQDSQPNSIFHVSEYSFLHGMPLSS